jgi:Valyl-tRNA synthetase
MPFITEEIWQSIAPYAKRSGETIMLQPYPTPSDFPRDLEAEREITPIQAVILGARQIRGQLDVPRSRQMPLFVITPSDAEWQVIAENRELIKALANATEISRVESEASLPPTAMQIVEGHTVHAPLSSLIDDVDVELARLAKRKAKITQDLARSEGKLKNENFVANAPREIVEQERARIAEFKQQIAQIEEQERRVSQLRKK